MKNEELKNFILLCLKDDDGISEEAYVSLIGYLNSQNEKNMIEELSSHSKSANGRRYIDDDLPAELFPGTKDALDSLTTIRKPSL